ncbi:DUF4188 domain-containing protein [Patulibacter sp. NPDC049589]|uniref:DUF4188 domain-containing protein n=1 Tax=Patulibacter sp. NPDC049589 TaxID=3154731 RepID=UPI00341E3932
MKAVTGRHAARIEGDFVVFLIGFRINRPWQVRRWVPVLLAMPPMIRELEAAPERGLLAAHLGWMFGGLTYVQYWRSFEQLEAYARAPDAEHLPAWARFNRRIRGTTAVGVYHETYRVRAGEYEGVYVDMPPTGLATAGEHVPVGSTSTAAGRLGLRDDDRAPVEP